MVFPPQRVDLISLSDREAFRVHLHKLLLPLAEQLRLCGFKTTGIDLLRYEVF